MADRVGLTPLLHHLRTTRVDCYTKPRAFPQDRNLHPITRQVPADDAVHVPYVPRTYANIPRKAVVAGTAKPFAGNAVELCLEGELGPW